MTAPSLTAYRPETPILTLMATTTPPSTDPSHPPRPNTATSVTIIMGLIRLAPQGTDIAITLNTPRIPSETGDDEEVDSEKDEAGKAVEDGWAIIREVWRTFKINDWGLFGPGE